MLTPDSPASDAPTPEGADPIVMYLVVNHDLAMSPGKLAVQVGHAVRRLTSHYTRALDVSSGATADPAVQEFAAWLAPDPAAPVVDVPAWAETTLAFRDRAVGERKITLRGRERDLLRLLEAAGPDAIAVIDHGHTELPPGALTVVGLRPMRRSAARPLVKRLQAL